jgi:hypothetical protein
MNAHFVVIIFLLSSTLVVADENSEFSDISELQESITTALISATNDPDGDVRFAAFSALKDQPRADAIVQAFRRGLDDDNPNVRQLALTKLVDYEGPTDEVLKRLISAIVQPELVGTASRLLTKIGEPAAPRLLEALKSDKASEKLAVVDILGNLPLGKHRKEAVTEVTTVLKDEDRDVRIGAIDALKRMAASQFGKLDAQYLKSVVGIIARYDANKDGILTENEWSRMRSDVSSADQDKDGRLTPQELAWYYSHQSSSKTDGD